MTIYDILKDSAYKTEQFSQTSIDNLNGRIIENTDKKGKPYAVVECLVRKSKSLLNLKKLFANFSLTNLPMITVIPYRVCNLNIPFISVAK